MLIPVAQCIAFRLQSRRYLVPTGGENENFRHSVEQGGVCRLIYSGDLFIQTGAMAGLTFRF